MATKSSVCCSNIGLSSRTGKHSVGNTHSGHATARRESVLPWRVSGVYTRCKRVARPASRWVGALCVLASGCHNAAAWGDHLGGQQGSRVRCRRPRALGLPASPIACVPPLAQWWTGPSQWVSCQPRCPRSHNPCFWCLAAYELTRPGVCRPSGPVVPGRRLASAIRGTFCTSPSVMRHPARSRI